MSDSLRDQRIHLMMTAAELRSIDEWRRREPDLPGRSEAIRRLVRLGIKVAAPARELLGSVKGSGLASASYNLGKAVDDLEAALRGTR